ncbi:MAG TPA: alpha/beta hydrolase family protein [Acidimicrobiales bacterium]|nr:alpha/beta hydrolase family protein [Acidimicrobiales bacterium]
MSEASAPAEPLENPSAAAPAAPRPGGPWRAVRRFLLDPRTVGVAQAGPRAASFLARSWSYSRGGGPPGHPLAEAGVQPSVGLAAQVLLDEVLISAMRNPRLFPRGDDYRRAGDEIAAARALWQERGWLADPGAYHREPAAPSKVAVRAESTLGQRFETVSFPSDYEPWPDEPGRDRWLGRAANRTAHAYVVRHRRRDRPWLVCIHGFGTGRAALDLRAFRARHLARDLGLNLLLPVLPVHGPRQEPGAETGEGFMSVNLVDSVHGLAQSAWDVRSAIRWIRSQAGEVPVGIYGISLGGYVTALTASVEDGLACAIAGIPATDMPDLYRRHSPPVVRRRAMEAGALGPDADAVCSVVSPLVLAPRVPFERRYVFAGLGDRMSNFDQAHRLWLHWGRPRRAWYPGGHIGFFLAAGVGDFIDAALAECGLTGTAPAPAGPPAGDPPTAWLSP